MNQPTKLSDIIKDRFAQYQNPENKKKYQATYHQQVAVDIAKGFDDMKNIGMYMKLVKSKGADYAKMQYDYVMGRSNIKNKIAYFLWLMKQRKITNTNGTDHTK